MPENNYEKFLSLIKSIHIKMPKIELPSLRIGDLTVSKPIIQGGMGVGISLSGLASAVAEQGGIGVIAANGIGMIEADYFKDGRAANIRALRKEIRKAKAASDGIIGVNIMVALNDFKELLETAVEEKADVIILGAGLPIKNIPVEKIREAGIKVIPIVSTVRAADLIFKMWKRIYTDVPDAVIVEGPQAGGHLGVSEEQIDDPAYKIETVVPNVVEAMKAFEEDFQKNIPVIAAGGIYSGEDIYKIMQCGAQAVQMGTRFVATEECDADPRFKEAYVSSRKEDIGIIKSPVGLPGRALVNEFLTKVAEKKRPFKCPWPCLAGCKGEEANYCISLALNNARLGKLERGFAFVGSNVYRVDKILPVAELIGELKAGYLKSLFAAKQGVLAGILQRMGDLREEYGKLEDRLAKLRSEYEQALSIRFGHLKKESAAPLSSIRAEYKKASNRLTELHLKLTEEAFETVQLLTQS